MGGCFEAVCWGWGFGVDVSLHQGLIWVVGPERNQRGPRHVLVLSSCFWLSPTLPESFDRKRRLSAHGWTIGPAVQTPKDKAREGKRAHVAPWGGWAFARGGGRMLVRRPLRRRRVPSLERSSHAHDGLRQAGLPVLNFDRHRPRNKRPIDRSVAPAKQKSVPPSKESRRRAPATARLGPGEDTMGN